MHTWSRKHAPINISLIGCQQLPNNPEQKTKNSDNLYIRRIKAQPSLKKT